MKSNPFFELYIGDKLPSPEFVTIFSPFLVPHAEAIFTPGNVVVSGVQGSGKSMLLSLLKPAIRLEYSFAKREFPVPKVRRKFLSASVNLAHQNAIDFGLRKEIDEDPQLIELLFADFLNYLVLQSFLESIALFKSAQDPFGLTIRKEVGLNLERELLSKAVSRIANLAIFEGWLSGCKTINDLQSRIGDRIRLYKRYNHRIDLELSPELSEKRTPIGEPIRECVETLQDVGVLDKDTYVFVEIDQYEELGNISSRDSEGKIVDYRAVVNRALTKRDPLVSYRIGTRGHAWRQHGKVMGTSARLEEERDYKYVDLDALLRRDENQSNDVFQRFAADVFARRLQFANYSSNLINADSVLRGVFGPKLSALQKVNAYNLSRPERALKLDRDWRKSTRDQLNQLARQDLLSAKLGEVWIRQKGDVFDLDVSTRKLPWEAKEYWQKERRELAALHIASRTKQRTLWCGDREIIGLAGGNILVFLSLNQFVWDTWLQYKGVESLATDELPEISISAQAVGISKASQFWIEKVAAETGRSAERLRFINIVAEALAKRLLSDNRLSNPGQNGFSITKDELEKFPEIRRFLEELADYGNLLMLDHTTKEKDRRNRKKFYLNPIFCPRFNLPYIRTKEPYYARVSEVAQWMHQAGVDVSLAAGAEPENDKLL